MNQKEELQSWILYEDESILVLNKPSGITVNVSQTTHEQLTVQEYIQAYFVQTSPSIFSLTADQVEHYKKVSEFSNPAEDFIERAGIVHRLDKETSGILIVAKTVDAFIDLQKQFRDRGVEKTYIALAHGKVEPKVGEIRVPVGRLPWNRKQFGVVSDGKDAVTQYIVQKYYQWENKKQKEDLSLVSVFPKTGRTHQIRVHMKYVNHPLFSDFLYAGRKTSRSDRTLLPRVFLHAATLSFVHPKTREKVFIESPLPKDLQLVLEKLQVI